MDAANFELFLPKRIKLLVKLITLVKKLKELVTKTTVSLEVLFLLKDVNYLTKDI